MLYHCLSHANQVNDSPYTDLVSKETRRAQRVAVAQNEANAQGLQRNFEAAKRETNPKALASLQRITASFIGCQPDTDPGRLW